MATLWPSNISSYWERRIQALIIESFITAELRNEIKYELRKSDLKKTNDFQYATDKKNNWNKFRQAIKIILTKNIDQIMYNPKDLEKLENARMKFSENNK